jgi:hypothetical protein
MMLIYPMQSEPPPWRRHICATSTFALRALLWPRMAASDILGNMASIIGSVAPRSTGHGWVALHTTGRAQPI